ncbi:hypothetical protein HBA55_28635 [Pseudomaricurvus alkylphenolicus]|uniref:c-type cytochrome n=1 Tax=Pseudomaricurvus alkylphenolicus TaxID=1306991 RepID=UPI001423C52E|nr:cytochrome c [Pseudomaricurvus alkylphenolicus]NIB43609.1 hypothetical protein [Pseudomaricurvus alkylphenolicus]
MIRSLGRGIKGLWHWAGGLLAGLRGLWKAIGPPWFRRLLATVGILAGVYIGLQHLLTPNLTHEQINQVHYLTDSWDSQAREDFYYTPQGTELLGMHYDWFVNLELPLSKERLAEEDNMRGWGFIVDPGQLATERNPGNLPVGMTRHIDPQTGLEKLDLGCAMCHTGELHYKGVALRVDGGQAVQSVPTAKLGEFITTLGASAAETYFNPLKWNRFADRVAGQDQPQRDQLREEFWQFLKTMKQFVSGPGASKYYPTEEGRGRTDAVGRIANVVFGYDLDVPENYHAANAPVSYPFLWDIWRFDWVQYTGFTNQAMARNIGESLGVLAPIKLVNDEGELLSPGEFGETVVDLDGMHCVESTLRDLKPPQWPEQILGKIDIARAKQGKALFAAQCAFCHGPHQSKPYNWPVASGPGENPAEQASVNWQWDMAGDITRIDGVPYRKDWRETIWSVPWIDVDVIGTDATAADNFNKAIYDARKLLPDSEPVNAGNGLQVLLNRLVPILYENWKITGEAVPDYDGLNVPFRIANKRAYKARPLHGVWATPPFLHNGSVPTIHDLLSPLDERPTTFAVGNREYDPIKLGYATKTSPGSFVHDTGITGNGNHGHLFTDVEMPGRIGERLSEEERMAIIEYLKVMGNPEFSEALDGDPLNWAAYPDAPADPSGEAACRRPRMPKQLNAQVGE